MWYQAIGNIIATFSLLTMLVMGVMAIWQDLCRGNVQPKKQE